jgi:hypothetical protein
MVGSFPLTIETPQALAERVASITLYGLPANFLQTYRTKMAAVNAAQVSEAARRVIRPQQSLIVVVGDGAKLYDKLAKIAPVTIRNADGDVMQASDLTPKVMATAFDVSQLKASRDSFVVMVQGNALGTSVVSVEAKSGGWTMSENTNIMNGMIAAFDENQLRDIAAYFGSKKQTGETSKKVLNESVTGARESLK